MSYKPKHFSGPTLLVTANTEYDIFSYNSSSFSKAIINSVIIYNNSNQDVNLTLLRGISATYYEFYKVLMRPYTTTMINIQGEGWVFDSTTDNSTNTEKLRAVADVNNAIYISVDGVIQTI